MSGTNNMSGNGELKQLMVLMQQQIDQNKALHDKVNSLELKINNAPKPNVVVAAQVSNNEVTVLDQIGEGAKLTTSEQPGLQKALNKVVRNLVDQVHLAHTSDPTNESAQVFISNLFDKECSKVVGRAFGGRPLKNIEFAIANDTVFSTIWNKMTSDIRRQYSNPDKNKYKIALYVGPNRQRNMLPKTSYVASATTPLSKKQIQANKTVNTLNVFVRVRSV